MSVDPEGLTLGGPPPSVLLSTNDSAVMAMNPCQLAARARGWREGVAF